MKEVTGTKKLAETAKTLKDEKELELFTPVYITQTFYIYESKINKK